MLKQQIDQQLKEAMRAKDLTKTTVLRSLNAAIKSWEIEAQTAIDEAILLSLIEKQLKQRKESIQAYMSANRPELAEKEQQEASILQNLLPEPLNDEEIEQIVLHAIQETGATSIKDMGKVMGLVKTQTAGRADPAKLSAMIKAKLT